MDRLCSCIGVYAYVCECVTQAKNILELEVIGKKKKTLSWLQAVTSGIRAALGGRVAKY